MNNKDEGEVLEEDEYDEATMKAFKECLLGSKLYTREFLLGFLHLPYFWDPKYHLFKHIPCVVLGHGCTFGELGIINGTVRSATSICKKDGVICILDGVVYRDVLKAAEERKIELKVNFFKERVLSEAFNYADILKIAYYFEKKSVCKGSILFQEKKPLTQVIILIEGEVNISRIIEFNLLDIDKMKVDQHQKKLIELRSKGVHQLNSRYSYQQNIAIAGQYEVLGIEGINKTSCKSKYTITAWTEKVEYWHCPIMEFMKLIESFPQFWKGLVKKIRPKLKERSLNLQISKTIKKTNESLNRGILPSNIDFKRNLISTQLDYLKEQINEDIESTNIIKAKNQKKNKSREIERSETYVPSRMEIFKLPSKKTLKEVIDYKYKVINQGSVFKKKFQKMDVNSLYNKRAQSMPVDDNKREMERSLIDECEFQKKRRLFGKKKRHMRVKSFTDRMTTLCSNLDTFGSKLRTRITSQINEPHYKKNSLHCILMEKKKNHKSSSAFITTTNSIKHPKENQIERENTKEIQNQSFQKSKKLNIKFNKMRRVLSSSLAGRKTNKSERHGRLSIKNESQIWDRKNDKSVFLDKQKISIDLKPIKNINHESKDSTNHISNTEILLEQNSIANSTKINKIINEKRIDQYSLQNPENDDKIDHRLLSVSPKTAYHYEEEKKRTKMNSSDRSLKFGRIKSHNSQRQIQTAQGMRHNPKIKAYSPFQTQLGTDITHNEYRWRAKTERMKFQRGHPLNIQQRKKHQIEKKIKDRSLDREEIKKYSLIVKPEVRMKNKLRNSSYSRPWHRKRSNIHFSSWKKKILSLNKTQKQLNMETFPFISDSKLSYRNIPYRLTFLYQQNRPISSRKSILLLINLLLISLTKTKNISQKFNSEFTVKGI